MTWICDPCGPIPASEVEGITHDSPHGQERHTVCDSDLVVLAECERSSGPRQDHPGTKDHSDPRSDSMTADIPADVAKFALEIATRARIQPWTRRADIQGVRDAIAFAYTAGRDAACAEMTADRDKWKRRATNALHRDVVGGEIGEALCADGIHEADHPCCSVRTAELGATA
jgi:hypothetical protein